MQHVDGVMDNTVTFGAPIASVGGSLYAIATDTFWVSVVTLIATVVSILYKTYSEAKNKSLEIKLESVMSAHKRELDEVKIACEDAFNDAVDKIKEMYDEEARNTREKSDLMFSEVSTLVKEMRDKNNGEVS